MVEETEKIPDPDEKIVVKKKGGWFQKIPSEVLFSPAGMILIAYAGIMELIDLIPIPFIDQLWEIPLEIGFIVLLIVLAKVSLKSAVIPFIIERIPIVSDIVPTWVIRMIG